MELAVRPKLNGGVIRIARIASNEKRHSGEDSLESRLLHGAVR